MDTIHQDLGMLEAYGLVYELLLDDVPVRWCIKPSKNLGDADFVTSATDFATYSPASRFTAGRPVAPTRS